MHLNLHSCGIKLFIFLAFLQFTYARLPLKWWDIALGGFLIDILLLHLPCQLYGRSIDLSHWPFLRGFRSRIQAYIQKCNVEIFQQKIYLEIYRFALLARCQRSAFANTSTTILMHFRWTVDQYCSIFPYAANQVFHKLKVKPLIRILHFPYIDLRKTKSFLIKFTYE